MKFIYAVFIAISLLAYPIHMSQASDHCQIDATGDKHIISMAGDKKIVSSVIDGKIGVRSETAFKMTMCNLPEGATILDADAIMPMHQHGMNYVPKIEKLADNQFLIQPYVFHMPGAWQLRTRVLTNGKILEFEGNFNVIP